MQNERKRILTMLENGTISMDEALTLLENLDGNSKKVKEEVEFRQKQTDETKSENNNKTDSAEEDGGFTGKNDQIPPMDEFIEDIRKDFVTVGDRFMQFMQTAVTKMKDFDFDSPFGNSTTFQHTVTKPVEKIDEIFIDIDHGSVILQTTDADEVRAEFTVKSYNSKSEEEAKKEFLNKMICVVDEGKLRLLSDQKFNQVNVDLFIPKQQYDKISVKLLNGNFNVQDALVERLYAKTANGKVDIERLKFKEADLETGNGSIRLNDSDGEVVEAETINGRVYLSGQLKDIEAKSLNGHVVVTTTDAKAQKIDAKTVSGSVEIYIPSQAALEGEISTNMGRLDLQLHDITKTVEQEQFLQRTVRFNKTVEGSTMPLYVQGEAKTGSVIVCYTVDHN